ncbi:MAG: N-acyl homoserine lactonase family protein [Rubrivivax sp.]
MNDTALPHYELYAIRYYHRPARRGEHFIFSDPKPDAPLDMDYFVWAAIGPERSFVIDLGFSAATAARRGRTLLRCPIESLRLIGLDPASVQDVLLTHLHYDHAGNFPLLPAARFHVQESELQFAASRRLGDPFFKPAYEIDDLVDVMRLAHAGRVVFYDGAAEVTPGIQLVPAPGHTAGLQVVRVHTRRGWVTLLSDTPHYFENLRARRPHPFTLDFGQTLDSYDRISSTMGSWDKMIPGHDPLLLKMYPAPSRELEGIVLKLDAEPDMSVFDAHWAAA